MAKRMSLTWWGRDFIEALERITDAGRLQRGRSYAGDSRILAFDIDKGAVTATVRGNKNPYFGVYTEPRYRIKLSLRKIAASDWQAVIADIASNAGWLTRLLQGEMPREMAAGLDGGQVGLLPTSRRDLQAKCSCPDGANPCKHIAGVYYRLAGMLDQDPFLLFQLRGMPPDKLQRALSATPLGQALASQLDEEIEPPEPQATCYPSTGAEPVAEPPDCTRFWRGGVLPAQSEQKNLRIPALAVRREGDRPPFWQRENSFIEAMSEIYLAVEKKNRDSL